jgi:hypothetical protein
MTQERWFDFIGTRFSADRQRVPLRRRDRMILRHVVTARVSNRPLNLDDTSDSNATKPSTVTQMTHESGRLIVSRENSLRAT